MPAATPDGPQYIPRKTVSASYRPKNSVCPIYEYLVKYSLIIILQLMSPGLKRAREPYRVRNAITGLTLAAFGIGVWAYSISAVKQDVFDDVDEEARALAGSGAIAGMKSIEDEQKQAQLQAPAEPVVSEPMLVTAQSGRGLLVKTLQPKYPALFDPTGQTLVWGAPSVDNVGRTSDRV
jgi:cytochrome c oxidase assembly factor 3